MSTAVLDGYTQERKAWRRPKLPRISFANTYRYVKWSNEWPRVDEDDKFDSVDILWWKARIDNGE